MREDTAARAMAAIGGTVAASSAFAPVPFLRLFGVPARDVTGATTFALRLFAARTAYLSALAWRGEEAARSAFLPVQLLDQAVFWHAFATRSIPRGGAVMAAGTSGAIIVLDAARRRAAGA